MIDTTATTTNTLFTTAESSRIGYRSGRIAHGLSVELNGLSRVPELKSFSTNHSAPLAINTCDARRHRDDKYAPSGVSEHTSASTVIQTMNNEFATTAAADAPGAPPRRT
ncbi:MAG TPA: hypothetical protein VGO03_13845 [Acidimicrobiia bacterium]